MTDVHLQHATNSREINIDDESECALWSRELGVSAGELKAAVHYAGRRSEDVRRYIRERTLPHDKRPWGKP